MGDNQLYQLVGEIHAMVKDVHRTQREIKNDIKDQDQRIQRIETWKSKIIGGTIVASAAWGIVIHLAIKFFF